MSCPSRCLITWPLFHRSWAVSREVVVVVELMELSGASLVFADPLWGETPGCNASTRTWTRIKEEVIKIGCCWGEVIEILTFPRNRQRPGTSASIWGREADEYHTLKPGGGNCPFSGLWFEIITWSGTASAPERGISSSFLCQLISGFVGQQIVIYSSNCVFSLRCCRRFCTQWAGPAGYHELTPQTEFHLSLHPHVQAAVSQHTPAL